MPSNRNSTQSKIALTFSNLNADTFESSLRAGRKRPRVREAVSCWQCRARKTRCDRALPCKQCQHRGLSSECRYGTPKDGASSPSPGCAKTSPGAKMANAVSSPLPDPNPAASPEAHSPAATLASGENGPLEQTSAISPATSSPKSIAGRRNTFRGSEDKTRLVGLSHWMAPSREMVVLKAMLNRSVEFQASQTAFDELKAILRYQSISPVRPLGNGADGSHLQSHLPDRSSCEAWTRRFCRTYNRIYGIADPVALALDIQQVYDGAVNNSVQIARLLMVTAIAMQNSEQDRIHGRMLARHVEECVVSSLRFQKPCLGAAQNLLLLMLMKTISASDTDKIYDLLLIQGVTTQIFTTMGLHRDPIMFSDVSPYCIEIRKRLWACFLRLSLEYCVRSGSQLTIRLDESDSPLPTPCTLQDLRPATMCEYFNHENDEQEVADASFHAAATKLVTIIIPLYQSLNSPNPPDLLALQTKAKDAFVDFSGNLPSFLSPGNNVDPIVELQRSMLTITMQSFLAIVRLGETLEASLNSSHRSHLMEAWDHAISVVHEFRKLSQGYEYLQNITFQFLWADVSRAALACCWIVGRLRRLDYGCTISSYPQQTVRIFHQILTESMSFMSQFWKARFHLGPVAAKVHLILTVAWKVTTKLYSDDYDPNNVQRKLLDQGGLTAENVIAEMKLTLQRRQTSFTLTPTPTDHGSSPAFTFFPGALEDTQIMSSLAPPLPKMGAAPLGNELSSFYLSSDVFLTSPLPPFQLSTDEDNFLPQSLSQFADSSRDSLWD